MLARLAHEFGGALFATAVAVVLALAAVYVREPPDLSADETPSMAVGVQGELNEYDAAGGSLPLGFVRVTVRVDDPLRCRRAHVRVSVTPRFDVAKDKGARPFNVTVGGDPVKRARGINLGPAGTHLQLKAVPLEPGIPVPGIADTGTILQGEVELVFADTLTIAFDAPWTRRRAVGSCWVRLPDLTGDEAGSIAALGNIEGSEEYQEGVDLRRRRSDVVVEGMRVDAEASEFPPTLNGRAWRCSPTPPEKPASATCAGWVAVDTTWGHRARDLSLLLCGAMVS